MLEAGLPRTRLMRFAWRLLRRDLGSGRLLVMLLAATIAVASTASVNLLVRRVDRALLAESSALLAGDLAVVTRDPVPAEYTRRAHEFALTTAHTVSLRSVVAVDERLQLVQLKAVDAAYPLRGELLTAPAPNTRATPAATGPAPGEVWADARLFQLLDLTVGSTLSIGRADFVLTRLLALEPDRGGDVLSLAPRVMMNIADLPATELIMPGSRATWSLLVAGPADAIDSYRATLPSRAGTTLVDPRESRPEMEAAFAQAERFLALAAFAGVLLATIGIALAAGALREHHERTVAILKTFGLTRAEVGYVLGLEILLLGLLATLLGDTLAWLTHSLLVARFIPGEALALGAMPLLPLVHGAWVACVILLGFALPALAQLTRLPVVAILNRDRARLPAQSRAGVAWMLGTAALIAPWHVGDAHLVAVAFSGMMAVGLAVAAVAYALVRILGQLRARTSMSWRFGLANIARRARLSVVQTTAIGLGLAVILLLGLVREDLIGQWRDRLPPQAPNLFLINIQPDEVAAMQDFLAARGLPDVAFYPMVRGRLSGLNGAAIELEDYANPRAQRLADREFNLSWATTLKADNRLRAGRWWSPDARNEMSVEQGIADLLGIGLGDTLEFTVADQTVRGQVTSLRELEWDNFEVNFFVVTTPDLLARSPATYITSFHLPPDETALMNELVRSFPSVTLIDVDALMRQVRQVMERVAGALGWVFGFALAAGALVLIAAVQASQRERMLDVVLLKTLGAPRRFITQTTLVEFAVLGAVAGLLGSAGAMATGWALAAFVFSMPYAPHWHIPALGVVSGMLGVTVIGCAAVWRTHRQAVMVTLRTAG